jgi:REP-associated tyrosine transposase
MAGHVWNLRSRRCFETIEDCLAKARERFGLRVIEFTVLGNHLHLVVEADRLLRSPTELVNSIACVLGNAAHHYGDPGQDCFSSRSYEAPRRNRILSHPRTWLLRSGWRRARTVPQWLTANAWPPPWVQQHPLPPRQSS